MTLLRLPRIPSALCALAALTLAPLNGWSQEPAVQVDWLQSPINGHWYGVTYTTGWNWEEARQRAQSIVAELATIKSQAQADWLQTWIEGRAVNGWFHFGLTQDEGAPEPAGGWRWVDGEPIEPSSHSHPRAAVTSPMTSP